MTTKATDIMANIASKANTTSKSIPRRLRFIMGRIL